MNQASSKISRSLRALALGVLTTTGLLTMAQSQSHSAVPAPASAAAPTSALATTASKTSAPSASTSQPTLPDRASAYYHAALAHTYEQMATDYGRQDYATRAEEEFKLALDADPQSPELAAQLAELYFRTGRIREAVETAKAIVKKDPDNLDAHKVLGSIYLRSLGQQTNSPSQIAPTVQMVDLAIAEYLKIVALEPNNVENHLLLGQLYSVKHDSAKAESEFQIARSLEPESEDVVMSLARLYAQDGDLQRSADLLASVPEDQRSPQMEFALGATYEQLKQPAKAVQAYQSAAEMDPENVSITRSLAQALLADNQLDAALKQYQILQKADPQDVNTLNRICEIQRRMGKYTDALATARAALAKDPTSLEAGYNEGLLLDVLGRYDESIAAYKQMLDVTSHANGAYTQDEKANRSIFLERLAAVYHEDNKTTEAIATYQKLIDMGGDFAKRGYQGQVDTYRDAKMFDEATAVCRKAVAANPNDRDLKLLLAWQLSDTGKLDEGISIARSLLNGTSADLDVYLQISQIEARQRHWKEAEQALEKAASLATKKEDKANVLFQQGSIAEQEKHIDQAEQDFRKVLDIDPNNAITLNNLGFMLADKTSRYTDALKYIRKAVDLEPMNGAYLDSLGWVYFKLGDYEPAEEYLRQAVERTSTDPTVHDHLGDLYEKTGRIRLAASQWEISLQEFSKSAPADVDATEVAKVQKKLESARTRLAKQDSVIGGADKQP
jgi:tetratricopeptide (TPR) repeat protein